MASNQTTTSSSNKVIQEIIQDVHISAKERQQVHDFNQKVKHKQLFQFDDKEIRKEQRASKLRGEFTRLLELKLQWTNEMETNLTDPAFVAREQEEEKKQEIIDRGLYSTVAENSIVYNEIMHRAKMRSTETLNYIYAKPRFMQLLEEECPTLFDPKRAFRNTFARAILLHEDSNPVMFMVQLEALEMIERGEMTQQEASMKLSKIAMRREGMLALLEKRLLHSSSSESEVREEMDRAKMKSNTELESMLNTLSQDLSVAASQVNHRQVTAPSLTYGTFRRTTN